MNRFIKNSEVCTLYDCKNRTNSYDFLRITWVYALSLSASFKPIYVVFAILFDMPALSAVLIFAIVNLWTKIFNLFAVWFLPLWGETKVKVTWNETKSKSRFFITFTFDYVYDYTFLLDLNYIRPCEHSNALFKTKSKVKVCWTPLVLVHCTDLQSRSCIFARMPLEIEGVEQIPGSSSCLL